MLETQGYIEIREEEVARTNKSIKIEFGKMLYNHHWSMACNLIASSLTNGFPDQFTNLQFDLQVLRSQVVLSFMSIPKESVVTNQAPMMMDNPGI